MPFAREPGCGVCDLVHGSVAPVFDTELWQVRPVTPAGIPGWMMMISKRHVAGPAYLDDREAAALGPALRHFERVLERVTGALRIYTAALGEKDPHFHAHMVPRYAAMPRDARGWSVFDLQRAVGAGEVALDPAEVARLAEAYAAALRADPPPA